MGYAPLRLVLGTSVYALGFARRHRGVLPVVRARRGQRGHAADLRGPRELPGAHPQAEAEAAGADGVIGIKVFIYEIGGELRRGDGDRHGRSRSTPGVTTQSEQLIPQAIIRDRDTFFDQTMPMTKLLERKYEN